MGGLQAKSMTSQRTPSRQKMADVLLWQRYDNNKMVAMRYYGNVFYIFNSTVIDWTSEVFFYFHVSILGNFTKICQQNSNLGETVHEHLRTFIKVSRRLRDNLYGTRFTIRTYDDATWMRIVIGVIWAKNKSAVLIFCVYRFAADSSYKYGAMRSTLQFLCGVLIKRAVFAILRHRVLFCAHRYDLRGA